MNTSPLVSIITINYNNFDVTLEFLESIFKITYPTYEVWVVDNASESFDESLLKSKYPLVNIIKSQENKGFAGGNNLGIEKAKGKYFLFINNDTEVIHDFLEPLVGTLVGSGNIGMISPLILYYNTNKIQYAGSKNISSITGRGARVGRYQSDIGQYKGVYSTDLIHGAAFLVSKEVISHVGNMYEGFFLYYEEYDWCLRAKKVGFEMVVNAESKIYHKESMSVGKNSALKTFYMTRNRPIFIQRNSSKIKYYLHIVYLFSIVFPKKFIVYLIKNDKENRKAFVSGFFKGIKISMSNEYKNRN